MGRPAAADLSVRGGQRPAASDKEMVRAEGMGSAPCQAQRHEEGAGRGGPEVGCDPALHLGRRDGLRMGERNASMTDAGPTLRLQA